MIGDAEFWSRQSRVSYFWLQQQLEIDLTFATEAINVLKHVNPSSTYTTASSASALLNHWVVERELKVYQRGKPVDDVAAVILYADEDRDYTPAMNAVEQGWRIDREEFAAILARYEMTVPDVMKVGASGARNNKRLIVLIKGREALPVRAIPYVTGWKMSPDVLAKNLARTNNPQFAGLQNLFAYHIQAGDPTQILPKEWDAVVVQLDALEAQLQIEFPDRADDKEDPRGYATWRKRATIEIPSGTFIWLDDFECKFLEDASSGYLTPPKERIGERTLNFSPMMADGVRETVLEGFDKGEAEKPANGVVTPSSMPERATTESAFPAADGSVAWKIAAVKCADDEGAKQWRSGMREISARGVAKVVAARLAVNRDYWGERGPRDAHTVRKQALKGWKFSPPEPGASGASDGDDSPQ